MFLFGFETCGRREYLWSDIFMSQNITFILISLDGRKRQLHMAEENSYTFSIKVFKNLCHQN